MLDCNVAPKSAHLVPVFELVAEHTLEPLAIQVGYVRNLDISLHVRIQSPDGSGTRCRSAGIATTRRRFRHLSGMRRKQPRLLP